ncbi:MAG: molybdopterin-synthase adenylyltransferase MoeB [Acidobacteriota bacterium]
MVGLSAEERRRYQRHLILPEFGEEGQLRLKRAAVLLVGAGGLGSPAGLYLTAAGVGRVGLIDSDIVDASNLQRQVLFGDADVGRLKVEAARDRLAGLNRDVQIETHATRFSAANAADLLSRFDLVLDGTDNFASRYLIGDACALHSIPLVQGSLFRFHGQVALFHPPQGPCHRCLFPEPPDPSTAPDCAEAGVLGVIPGLIGTLMAAEAIKHLAGLGASLLGRLLRFDALTMRCTELSVPRDPHCPLCSAHRTITTLQETTATCSPETLGAGSAGDITPHQLAARLFEADPPFLLDVRETWEWDLGHLDGATLIPIGDLPERLEELPRDREIVVYCKVGARSDWAANFLRARGFSNIRNLEGGIMAWMSEIDTEAGP